MGSSVDDTTKGSRWGSSVDDTTKGSRWGLPRGAGLWLWSWVVTRCAPSTSTPGRTPSRTLPCTCVGTRPAQGQLTGRVTHAGTRHTAHGTRHTHTLTGRVTQERCQSHNAAGSWRLQSDPTSQAGSRSGYTAHAHAHAHQTVRVRNVQRVASMLPAPRTQRFVQHAAIVECKAVLRETHSQHVRVAVGDGGAEHHTGDVAHAELNWVGVDAGL